MSAVTAASPPPAATARSPNWPALLKDAVIAAVIAGLLALELVGIETVDRPTGLDFVTRFDDVLAAMLLIFFGRLAMLLPNEGRPLWGLILAGGFTVWMLASLIFGNATIGFLGATRPFESTIVNWMVTIPALVLAIRAAVALFRGVRPAARPAAPAAVIKAPLIQRLTPWIGAAMIVFGFVLPWMDFSDRRVMDMGVLVLTYVMLGWGLNIVVGLAGLLDLGYVAFYAVGAYSYALLAHYFDLGFWVCLPLAGIMAAFFGILLGFPVLRLRGDYLAIVTLGFGEIIRIVLINWWWFTGGPDGIRDIPRPDVPFLGWVFERNAPEGGTAVHEALGIAFSPLNRIIFLYYIVLILALCVNFFTLRIRRLPIGRAWEALREDETACRALGINPTNTKLSAFAIGAGFGGFAGSFFATRQGFISPESFTFIESAVILAIVVLGGLGSQVGIVIASILLIGVPELFRELAEYRMLAFGAGMVLIMIWKPRGLLSHRAPTVRLFKERRVKLAQMTEGSG